MCLFPFYLILNQLSILEEEELGECIFIKNNVSVREYQTREN